MKRMHSGRWQMSAVLLLALALTARAWQPAGWTYWDWPWAYDPASGCWHWFAESNTQWIYAYPPGHGWLPLAQSGIAHGWSYWNGEWAYDGDSNAWCWRNTGDTQWCVNMRTQTWSILGYPGLEWQPGYSIGSVALGNSYAAVRANMGDPTEVRQTEHDGEISLWSDYDGEGLYMCYTDTNGNDTLDDQDTVDGIFANNLFGTSPLWTFQGITFGSSLEAAQAVLGTPNLLSYDSAWWFDLGTMLFFGDNGLFEIYIYFGF